MNEKVDDVAVDTIDKRDDEGLGVIERGGVLPYYHQLKAIIAGQIASGRWAPGTRIPSEPELCKLLDVSRTVVRQALGELENERVLVRRKGLGTFVAEPKVSGRLFQSLTGFHDDMLSQGHSPRTRVIDSAMVPATDLVAGQLDLTPGAKVVRIERLRSVDAEPIVLVTTWLPHELCAPLLEVDLTDRSLYQELAKLDLHIQHGKRTVEAVSASTADSRLLGVKRGEPLLFLRSVTYLADGRAIEYYEAKHRGDRTSLEVELVKNPKPGGKRRR